MYAVPERVQCTNGQLRSERQQQVMRTSRRGCCNAGKHDCVQTSSPKQKQTSPHRHERLLAPSARTSFFVSCTALCLEARATFLVTGAFRSPRGSLKRDEDPHHPAYRTKQSPAPCHPRCIQVPSDNKAGGHSERGGGAGGEKRLSRPGPPKYQLNSNFRSKT